MASARRRLQQHGRPKGLRGAAERVVRPRGRLAETVSETPFAASGAWQRLAQASGLKPTQLNVEQKRCCSFHWAPTESEHVDTDGPDNQGKQDGRTNFS